MAGIIGTTVVGIIGIIADAAILADAEIGITGTTVVGMAADGMAGATDTGGKDNDHLILQSKAYYIM